MKRPLAFAPLLALVVSISSCNLTAEGPRTIDAANLRWEEVGPIPIGPRDGHTAVWTGEEVLLWGGGPQIGAGSAEGASFDPSTEEWTSIEPAPIGGRWFHTAVWTGEEMIVWGGRQPGLYKDGAAYNPSSDTWRVIAESPLQERSDHVAVWTGEEMIVYGGHTSLNNNAYIGDAAAYNPETDSWRQLPDPGLSERMDAAAVWIGEELVIWGGVYTEGWLNDGAIYNPESDSWRQIADSPLDPRQSAAAVIDGESVVFLGGVHNGETFESPAARYLIDEDRWVILESPSAKGEWPLTASDNAALLTAGRTLFIDGQFVNIPSLPADLVAAGTATDTGNTIVLVGGEGTPDTPAEHVFVMHLEES